MVDAGRRSDVEGGRLARDEREDAPRPLRAPSPGLHTGRDYGDRSHLTENRNGRPAGDFADLPAGLTLNAGSHRCRRLIPDLTRVPAFTQWPAASQATGVP
jgi:hypothetical protein